jgi:hypothetical protein
VSAPGEQAERAALACMRWTESAGDRVREITTGLDPAVRAEVLALLADPAFYGRPRGQRESRLIDLAGKSATAEVS